MTYSLSPALQSAIYNVLSNDTTLAGLVGSSIFDAPPTGVLPPIYVLLGEESVTDRSSKTSAGAMHDFSISIVSGAAGFADAKTAAATVCDVLDSAAPNLTRGIVTSLRFLKARALRGSSPENRRINLHFRAFVDDI